MTHHSQAPSNPQSGWDCSTRNPHVRPATKVDAYFIAKYLRQADAEEVALSSGRDPRYAMLLGISRGEAWVGMCGSNPAVIFGCTPNQAIPGWGIPWMLGTDDIHKIRIEFIRNSYKVVDAWLKTYKVITNYVHENNRTSKLWLRKLGFILFPAETYGVGGGQFNLFMRKA